MRPLPSPSAGLPRCSNHHAYVPCPLPRRIGTGAFVDCFPVPRGLPQTLGGSASALSFSRPAQASLALRPARLLNRPRRPLSRGFDGAGCPATPPVSYQLNRQLAGWNPPPQVIRASEAHQRLRTCGALRKMLVTTPTEMSAFFPRPVVARYGILEMLRAHDYVPLENGVEALTPPSTTTRAASDRCVVGRDIR